VHAQTPVTDAIAPAADHPFETGSSSDGHRFVIIGAGPAGLTAAWQLTNLGISDAVVLESDEVVGGISRTVERDGWRFDLGGHRFFTKVGEVEKVWHDILGPDEFMLRPRLSRIYYDGKFFDYPLKASNALKNLGPIEAAKCVASYVAARIRPPEDQSNFEGWTSARFGKRLYRTFFKTYTEKVWGVPATEIQADWAAQRIKNLSLYKAVANSLLPWKRRGNDVTSLIEEFLYPVHGPGMMWERCTERVAAAGIDVEMRQRVVRIERDGSGATTVWTAGPDGRRASHHCEHVISSMPINALVEAMDPPAPPEVLAAARALKHRDFLTVALVVPEEHGFPDNWIYVHSPEVKLGRVQNFRSWSPGMVKPGRTCLGLEYFVNIGDELWVKPDAELIELASAELTKVGLVPAGVVQAGYVVRVPGAYPVYDADYGRNVDTIREWLEAEVPNVVAVGRNGMHRYNNQDHSMLTALLAVENIVESAGHNLWEVNVEESYHEEHSDDGTKAARGTGRAAPVLPG
jgi:protoporphyrinogen oxidase